VPTINIHTKNDRHSDEVSGFGRRTNVVRRLSLRALHLRLETAGERVGHVLDQVSQPDAVVSDAVCGIPTPRAPLPYFTCHDRTREGEVTHCGISKSFLFRFLFYSR